jgi:CBS domain-containing protein
MENSMALASDLFKTKKNNSVFTVSPENTVQVAVKEMSKNNVGALLVENAEGKVVGIITERDVLLKLAAKDLPADSTLVSEIMTEKVLYVEATQPLEECMEIMNSKGFRHLPVFEKGKLLGLISVKDVLRQVIAEQKTMIKHLENYISGL